MYDRSVENATAFVLAGGKSSRMGVDKAFLDLGGRTLLARALEAAGTADIDERLRAVRTLLAEETQVSMLVGVAVGYELAHELMDKEKN